MSDFEPAAFAKDFHQFLENYERLLPPPPSTVKDMIVDHLGVDVSDLPTVSHRLEVADHPNLQLALDALVGAHAGSAVIGLPAELAQFGSAGLSVLVAGRFGRPVMPCPVEYTAVPIGIEETLPCAQVALHLLWAGEHPVVVFVRLVDRGSQRELIVEAMAASPDAVVRLFDQLRRVMRERNVYRGKVLSFSYSQFGQFGLQFHRLPVLSRDQVILPEADMAAIEGHTVGMSRHGARLAAAGQHVKRGLLLYGPPGTGKTLSVMWLSNAMPERTTLLLGGPSVGALGQAVAIARSLQPAMVVLEDVDLIALERTSPGARGSNPLLFQLLNEMDGLAEDADVIFVLTTNRAELLEPALAERPGRIDQAVEIKLPDAAARRRLFELYLGGLGATAVDVGALADQSEGVSPAFIKELTRRAALAAVTGDAGGADDAPIVVTTEHVLSALGELRDSVPSILRASLGAASSS